MLAVTTNPDDDPLLTLARRLGVRWFRGSEHDVLSRYRGRRGGRRRPRRPCHRGLPAHRPGGDGHRRRGARGASVDVRLRVERSRALVAAGARESRRLARRAGTHGPPRDVSGRARARDLVLLRGAAGPLRASLCPAPVQAADLRWTVDTAEDLAVVRQLYAVPDLADRPCRWRTSSPTPAGIRPGEVNGTSPEPGA